MLANRDENGQFHENQGRLGSVRRPGRGFYFRPCRRHRGPSRRPCGFGANAEPSRRFANPVAAGNEHTFRGRGGTTRQIRHHRNRDGSCKSGDSANRPGGNNSGGCYCCQSCCFYCWRSRCCQTCGYRYYQVIPDTIAPVFIASVDRASDNVGPAAEAPAVEAHAAEPSRHRGFRRDSTSSGKSGSVNGTARRLKAPTFIIISARQAWLKICALSLCSLRPLRFNLCPSVSIRGKKVFAVFEDEGRERGGVNFSLCFTTRTGFQRRRRNRRAASRPIATGP
jgi:hypothetical protein